MPLRSLQQARCSSTRSGSDPTCPVASGSPSMQPLHTPTTSSMTTPSTVLTTSRSKHGGLGKAKPTQDNRHRHRNRGQPLRYGAVRGVPDCPREPLRRFPACIRPCSSIRYFLCNGNGKLQRRPERLVPVHAHAQGRLVTSRLLRLRPAGPVRFRKLHVNQARRGITRRAPWTELPQLCNERRTPGRIRRNRRLPPTLPVEMPGPCPR